MRFLEGDIVKVHSIGEHLDTGEHNFRWSSYMIDVSRLVMKFLSKMGKAKEHLQGLKYLMT